MTMCPYCDKVYDESEYTGCPYCSGELEEEHCEKYYKICPNCDGIMYWENGIWGCVNRDICPFFSGTGIADVGQCGAVTKRTFRNRGQ